jgi:hypothetical protein
VIVSDTRTPCLTADSVRRRLLNAARQGATGNDAIADAIADALNTAESFLGERIEQSAVIEEVPAAQVIRLSIQPVREIGAVTVDSAAVSFTHEDGIVTLDTVPSSTVRIEYTAGKAPGDLATCVAVIKRAATRIFTNPTGVTQAQGPGSGFYPEPSGVQAILTKSERDTLLTTRERWYVG